MAEFYIYVCSPFLSSLCTCILYILISDLRDGDYVGMSKIIAVAALILTSCIMIGNLIAVILLGL